MKSKTILISGCDDNYANTLLEMLKSIVNVADRYAVGICDLGLSEKSKKEILKTIPHAQIKIPDWYIDFPDKYKNIFAYDIACRPFMPEIFPGYDGYMHVDADIWFCDATAIDNYVTAGQKYGIAITYERFATSDPYLTVRRKYRPFPVLRVSSVMTKRFKLFFGKEAAIKYGNYPALNGGFVYIKAGNPAWQFWQDAIGNLDYDKVVRKHRLCDQTCLQYSILHNNLPYQIMSHHHNWLILEEEGANLPLWDNKKKRLVDSVYPHEPIKVLHLGGSHLNREFILKTTDGGTLKSKLTYSAISKL